MTVISTRLTVSADGSISTPAPLPTGVHSATIEVADRPKGTFADIPTHDGAWDDRIPLGRDDMYGDDGR